MQFGNRILEYWDDILADLKTMVAVPSVSSAPDGKYPFGVEAARAVDLAMDMAQSYGLKAKNIDYYAMHAEYGVGEENAVVMAHIDVVPAGGGWKHDPFDMIIENGNIYGRGVLDNKGPAIVALHCLRALKDAGIAGRRKLRVVLGSSEETGMNDVGYYFAREQHPTMGFTPDASYGICSCEKGILTYTARGANDSPLIKSFKSGTVSNAVPEDAVCVLNCSEAQKDTLASLISEKPEMYSMKDEDGKITVTAQGVASHAAMPETGVNAASHLACLLCRAFGSSAGTFLTYIYEKIGTTYDGSGIGAAMSDEESGALTFNLGIVSCDEKSCSLTVNIRYPATKSGAEISEILRAQTESSGLAYRLDSDAKPLYMPRDSGLIKLLSKAYRDVTGEDCGIYSMGGGTYAREMFGAGVAFGSEFPARPDGIPHTNNEYISLENLKLHAQICLEAMYLMLTEVHNS